MEKLLKIFAVLRKILESTTWKWFQPKDWQNLEDLDKWEEVREYYPEQFSQVLAKYPYKYDKVQGLLDNTHPIDDPQYFFKNLDTDRDCDNWAREWVAYYRYHNMPCQEWIVTNKQHPFTQSHLIAVANEGDGWRLLNYDRYPNAHETVEEAIDDIETFNSGNYAKDVRLQCLYRDWPT